MQENIVTASQANLREVFDEVTRFDPSAHQITIRECESVTFRARRASQPKIPITKIQFL